MTELDLIKHYKEIVDILEKEIYKKDEEINKLMEDLFELGAEYQTLRYQLENNTGNLILAKLSERVYRLEEENEKLKKQII